MPVRSHRGRGPAVIVEEREYARLLGYPWGTPLEGEVLERARTAAEWYEKHGKPRVYCVSDITGITAGHEVDREVERLWRCDAVDDAYFLDRYAAAVVENLAAGLGELASPGNGSVPFELQWQLYSRLASLNPEIE